MKNTLNLFLVRLSVMSAAIEMHLTAKARSHLTLAFVLFGLGASLVRSPAQVILNPNTIGGHVHFSNANAAIVSLLAPPGNEGLSNVVVVANSIPPAPAIAAYSDNIEATNRTVTSYQLTVDSANPGIAYALSPYAVIEGDQYVYYFNTRTSAPVVIGTPPPDVNFDECVGVVTVQFVTSGGVPLPVDGGKIIAYSLPDSSYAGVRSTIAAGSAEQRIYLRGGTTHQLDITVHRGTNFYGDRIETFLSTNVPVTCDTFTTVKMVLPDSGVLASIVGNVDFLGQFELTAAANPAYDYPNYTTVIANYGPFSNQRWGALPGENFTTPSSGAYTLSNVVPSTLDPGSVGYVVSAQMLIHTNRLIQVFQTPALGWGANPPLSVDAGEALDLTNLFVINPGYLRGRVLLQGPPESLGHSSLLRGVQHAGDDDLDDDGIPDLFGTYGIYYTTVEALGVDRLASGATFTAAYGLGYGDFPGDFNPATSAYEGQYELALGGLLSESSIWKQKYFNLTLLSSPAITNDADYFYNVLSISEDDTNDVEIVPGQAVAHDVAYCMSEVKVVFRSTSGTFYQPNIRFASGSFTGTDFLGRAADYDVEIEAVYGTPLSSATASNIGQVVMYLPQGAYHLNPSVTPAGGNAQAGLEPLDITVGCGQTIALEPCLQLSLDAPSCANTRSVNVSGAVRSCSNDVASISYSLNSGPPQTICDGCGINPSFGFNVVLTAAECVDNTLTVTATDDLGGSSSVTTTIHYDATPPVIQCPADIVAGSCDTNGAIVDFTVTATDNCSGPVSIVCTPASGSLFPAGTTPVRCVASDTCGNTNQCTFNVTVAGGSQLAIQLAVAVTWSCTGTLQEAVDLTGPWTDIPGAVSPYFVIASAANKFYRVRQ
ncbi:MAG TPA: HYR domain-containing protein [Candidatus Acidoferrum sp.]|nr:HYR domain-containing protein [Candidatus Acidoferrum sp.]